MTDQAKERKSKIQGLILYYLPDVYSINMLRTNRRI